MVNRGQGSSADCVKCCSAEDVFKSCLSAAEFKMAGKSRNQQVRINSYMNVGFYVLAVCKWPLSVSYPAGEFLYIKVIK